MEDKHKKSTTRPRPERTRPTIGLFIEWLEQDYQTALLSGVAAAAAERDVNLICFAGGRLESPATDERTRNRLYDLASAERLDGLVFTGASISTFVSPEAFKRFCERYQPLPVVSIGLAAAGVPSVVVDNKKGLRDAILHLIEHHGLRRIAFIRGPEGNTDAEERYGVYIDTLTTRGIPVDPQLVVPGDFSEPAGQRAVATLLDERRVQFEAILAANDAMALSAMDTLQARGIRVPHDVTVAGFDDIGEAQRIVPALTTVRQPLQALGKQAIDMLLGILTGAEVPDQIVLPTEVVIRQSCGCLPAIAQHISVADAPETRLKLATVFAKQRDEICAELADVLGTPTDMHLENAAKLLDAFLADVSGASPGAFTRALSEMLCQAASTDGNMEAWQQALSILHRHALPPLLRDGPALGRAESLWQQGRILISGIAQQVQASRARDAEHLIRTLSEASQAMLAATNIMELANIVAAMLPTLGIQKGYMALYDTSGQHPGEARLILAQSEQGRFDVGPEGKWFPLHKLVPEECLPATERYTLAIESLHDLEHLFGFILLDMSPEKAIYEILRRDISTAMRTIRLLWERQQAEQAVQEHAATMERRAKRLQAVAEVAREATAILDVQQLLEQVTYLISNGFGLHHVGVFLMDEQSEYIILRAASSESGRRMIEQGYRLRVDESNIISRVASSEEPFFAIDVGQEVAKLINPNLPQTRAQIALPLQVRSQVIGVLDIHAADPKTFDQADVAVFQLLADQLAIAIDNARLMARTGIQLRELSRLHAEHTAAAWTAPSSQERPTAYVYDRIDVLPTEEPPSPLFDVAMGRGETIAHVDADQTGAVLAIPLKLRGQTIGVLGIQNIGQARAWSQNEVALAEAVSDQVAQALESARLFEETQRRAQRERYIYEITARLRRSPDITTILQTTVNELGRALRADRALIRLGVKPRQAQPAGEAARVEPPPDTNVEEPAQAPSE